MANWAYIENENIKEVHEKLPKNWRNVSNLNALESNSEMLRNLGWYPVNHNRIDYDPIIQTLKSISIKFDGKKVYETLIAEDIDTSVLYNEFIKELKEQRNKLLQDSDFMCLHDLISIKGQDYANDITSYRQQLRDLPNLYLNAGVVYNINSVVWPTKPNLNDYPRSIKNNQNTEETI